MLELAGIIIGIIVSVFVLIFGGRGLIDIARERRERKRQTLIRTTTIIDPTEITTRAKEAGFTGPGTEVTTAASQPSAGPEKEPFFLQERIDKLADQPSIAVLPFENLSGDPEQEYFSDGITEDIITALSRIRQFFVIARNSTFAYKGASPDVRRVSKELGVRYVLEGSVRKAAGRVRISAQLIEGTTGSHIWAERYDRDLEDVFAVQDEITQTVVGTIEPELTKAERKRAEGKKPENLDSWDLYQRGMYLVQKRTKEDLQKAHSLFERAIESNSTFGPAFSGLALCHHYLVTHRLSDSLEQHREKAILAARRAVELDDEDALSHAVLGVVHHGRRELDEALLELQTAVALNPSSA